ncbi:MAG: glycosyltransferase [Verrucomicrobiota bacterium]
METLLTIVAGSLLLVSLGLLAHTYLIYPLLMACLSRGRKLPEERYVEDSEFPEVAVLMAAYNEEAVLESTLTSIFGSDYPMERVTVWIGSDGSTDCSHEIIERFAADFSNLTLEIFEGRNGKIRIINSLARKAKERFSDPATAVFVICDANIIWETSALRRMVAHLKRVEVGLVGCSVVDASRQHEGIGDQEETYVGLENRLKYAEGVLWGNMIGAFGACYSMNASLFTPVPESYIVDDFFQTFSVLEKGCAAIVEIEAVCYEAVSTDIEEEFRRKQRIARGNFQNLEHFRSFLLPWNGGWSTSFAFWSHKGLRWNGPGLFIGAFISSAVLAVFHPIGLVPLFGMIASFAVAGIDWLQARSGAKSHFKPFRFLRYLYAMNGALFLGWLAYLKGSSNSVWEPTKRVGELFRASAHAMPPREEKTKKRDQKSAAGEEASPR